MMYSKLLFPILYSEYCLFSDAWAYQKELPMVCDVQFENCQVLSVEYAFGSGMYITFTGEPNG